MYHYHQDVLAGVSKWPSYVSTLQETTVIPSQVFQIASGRPYYNHVVPVTDEFARATSYLISGCG